MKKTLLIAAAALVATVISSEAQVYSANVVGYVNVTLTGGQYALLANPLDNGTNNLTSLLPTAPNQSQVQIWNGSSYQVASKSFGNWNTNLNILPGQGFFVKVPANLTNTFVGNVIAAVGGSVTNGLTAGGYMLVGSPIPYADNLTGTNLNLQVANQSQIQVWNGTSYQVASKSFGNWNTNLNLSVAQGFFLKSATATNWVQTLPAN